MGLIVSALRPMLRLWVRSQLTAVETLQIRLEARDREFLQGQLQKIELQASAAVYQGLHLGQANLVAEGISLQWQPAVGLQAPSIAKLHVELAQADFAASLASPLLQSGLADLLERAFGQNPLADRDAIWETARLEAGAVILTGREAQLELGLTARERDLVLAPIRLQLGDRAFAGASVAFDLGDGTIESLDINRDRLQLRGQLVIRPAAIASDVPRTAQTAQTPPSVDSEVSGSR